MISQTGLCVSFQTKHTHTIDTRLLNPLTPNLKVFPWLGVSHSVFGLFVYANVGRQTQKSI
jgi:hypothetical protein